MWYILSRHTLIVCFRFFDDIEVSWWKIFKFLWGVRSIRSSHSEVFLGKGVLKICCKFTGERPCRSAISIKLQICSPANLLHIFRTPFSKNTSGRLLLEYARRKLNCIIIYSSKPKAFIESFSETGFNSYIMLNFYISVVLGKKVLTVAGYVTQVVNKIAMILTLMKYCEE